MATAAELDSARSLILQACFENYARSPTAWAIWHQADVQAHDAIDRAARRLEDEGLIKAQFAADRTIVHAQLTMAGVRYMESLAAPGAK